MEKRIRIVLAKSVIDIHDRGVKYLAHKLKENGMEVIYILFSLPKEIVDIAIQEDADVIGLSSSIGGHMYVLSEVIKLLKAQKIDILTIVGGIIPNTDLPELHKMGIDGVFGPGRLIEDSIEYIRKKIQNNQDIVGTS